MENQQNIYEFSSNTNFDTKFHSTTVVKVRTSKVFVRVLGTEEIIHTVLNVDENFL